MGFIAKIAGKRFSRLQTPSIYRIEVPQKKIGFRLGATIAGESKLEYSAGSLEAFLP